MPREPVNSQGKLRAIIHAGEWYASREATMVYTLLGSCVAVCLYDPVARTGGMNHILLPGRADFAHYDAPTRYGINAMETLVQRLLALGADRRRLAAKVFGGGHVLVAIDKAKGVGLRNIAFVRSYLAAEKFRILAEDLGGTDTRRIWFQTDTGEVFLKRTRMAAVDERVAAQERTALDRVKRDLDRAGDVTLFE